MPLKAEPGARALVYGIGRDGSKVIRGDLVEATLIRAMGCSQWFVQIDGDSQDRIRHLDSLIPPLQEPAPRARKATYAR